MWVYIRKLPGDIVLGAETLAALLQAGKVAGRHHAGAVLGGAGDGKGARNLLLRPRDVILLVVLLRPKGVRVGAAEGELAGLDVLHAHALPVEQVAEALGAVALVDALAAALAAKVVHVAGELVDRVVDALGAAVDNVDAVVARVLDELLHVAAEAGEVGGDAGDAHDGALGGGVAPGLVVGRKDAEVAAADKVVVVEGQDGVGRVEELGVEDDLDAVGGVVEEVDAADLVEDGVFVIVDHVVGDNRGETVSLHGEEAAAQQDAVLAGDELLFVGQRLALVPLEGALEYAAADALLDDVGGVAQRLDDGLALEGLDGERRRLGGHDDEGDDGHLAAGGLEAVIEAGEGLDEHVDALVAKLVAAGREDVDGVVGLKVVVAVKVAADKVVNLFLGDLVQVLELVDGRELGDVEAVGQDAVGLALEQVLRLERGDVGDGGEDVARVGGGALDAVAVVDAALAGLGVDVEALQVVVEVDGAGAEVAAEEGGVGGEDGGDVDAALLGEGEGDAGEPLVEVGNDGLGFFVADKLDCQLGRVRRWGLQA